LWLWLEPGAVSEEEWVSPVSVRRMVPGQSPGRRRGIPVCSQWPSPIPAVLLGRCTRFCRTPGGGWVGTGPECWCPGRNTLGLPRSRCPDARPRTRCYRERRCGHCPLARTSAPAQSASVSAARISVVLWKRESGCSASAHRIAASVDGLTWGEIRRELEGGGVHDGARIPVFPLPG